MSQPNGDLPAPWQNQPRDASADIEHFLANDPGFQRATELEAAIRWGVAITAGRPLPSLEQLDYYADVCNVSHARVLRGVVREEG